MLSLGLIAAKNAIGAKKAMLAHFQGSGPKNG
jgi:hypothetical protein